MLFENNEIDITNLPKVESINYETLLSDYKKVVFINWTLLILVFPALPFLLELIIQEKIQFWYFFLFYILILILYVCGLIVIKLGFPKKGYALRKKDIVYRSGFFIHIITTVPYNRIQHIEIRQGIISRWYGLSKLKIYTAGGYGSGLYINGISPETAQQLKDYLSNAINHYE